MVIECSPPEVRAELKIYSCPKVLCQPIEWALSEILKRKISLSWIEQQIAPSTMSTEIKWIGPVGLCSRLVSTLSKWPKMRLEAFQESYKEYPAERYALSPHLGIFRTDVNSLGETIITENKLRSALERCQLENEPFEVELAFILGTPWDEDLEPFRRTHSNNSLKWIRKTG